MQLIEGENKQWREIPTFSYGGSVGGSKERDVVALYESPVNHAEQSPSHHY